LTKKDTWSVKDSETLYGIRQWGTGFFSAAENGNLVVTPRDGSAGTIDMFTLVDDLALRGVDLPIVLRFDDILRSQIKRINTAFSDAIAEFEYENRYRLAFPIKVNQQRQVIDSVREAGRE
jgi:arginine decarboxylase